MTCLNMALGSFGNYYISLCFSTLVKCVTLYKNMMWNVFRPDHCRDSSRRMWIPSKWKPDNVKGPYMLEWNRARKSKGTVKGTSLRREHVQSEWWYMFIRYRLRNCVGDLITVVTQWWNHVFCNLRLLAASCRVHCTHCYLRQLAAIWRTASCRK